MELEAQGLGLLDGVGQLAVSLQREAKGLAGNRKARPPLGICSPWSLGVRCQLPRALGQAEGRCHPAAGQSQVLASHYGKSKAPSKGRHKCQEALTSQEAL